MQTTLADALTVAEALKGMDVTGMTNAINAFTSFENTLSSAVKAEAQQLFQDAVFFDYAMLGTDLGSIGLNLGSLLGAGNNT